MKILVKVSLIKQLWQLFRPYLKNDGHQGQDELKGRKDEDLLLGQRELPNHPDPDVRVRQEHENGTLLLLRLLRLRLSACDWFGKMLNITEGVGQEEVLN